jgi:hypothetical protein
MNPSNNRAPELPPRCGSWVIVCRHTGMPVRETFDRRLADSVVAHESDRFEVLTALDWLQQFNATARNL